MSMTDLRDSDYGDGPSGIAMANELDISDQVLFLHDGPTLWQCHFGGYGNIKFKPNGSVDLDLLSVPSSPGDTLNEESAAVPVPAKAQGDTNVTVVDVSDFEAWANEAEAVPEPKPDPPEEPPQRNRRKANLSLGHCYEGDFGPLLALDTDKMKPVDLETAGPSSAIKRKHRSGQNPVAAVGRRPAPKTNAEMCKDRRDRLADQRLQITHTVRVFGDFIRQEHGPEELARLEAIAKERATAWKLDAKLNCCKKTSRR